MTRNPFLNALCATLYISAISTVLYNAPRLFGKVVGVMAPIIILSLFVFSAAVMAYIFLYQPIQLYVDGAKKEATRLFLRTLGSFAAVTLLMVAAYLVAIR